MRVAVARDRAFGFYYPDDLDALERAGCSSLIRSMTIAFRTQTVFLSEVGFPRPRLAEANASLRDASLEIGFQEQVSNHSKVAKAVIERGLACIVEKPASEIPEEFYDLVKLARDRKVFLSIALHAAHALEVGWWSDNSAKFDLGKEKTFQRNRGKIRNIGCSTYTAP